MAGISQYLKKIKEAVYGEEVRGSIHDAIQQAYTDANDVVKVSETQPTEENVKIWIKPESDEMKVPTWEEFEELRESVEAGAERLSGVISPTKNLIPLNAADTSGDGFISFKNLKRIPAGTYTLTINITTDPEVITASVVMVSSVTYSTSKVLQRFNFTPNTDFIGTFTVEVDVLSVYVFASTSVSNSAGHNLTINKLQIEEGDAATEVIDSDVTAVDIDARSTANAALQAVAAKADVSAVLEKTPYNTIPDGDSADDYHDGKYYAWTSAHTPKGVPGLTGAMIAFGTKAATTVCQQLLFGTRADDMFYRIMQSSGWEPWRAVVSSIIPKAEDYDFAVKLGYQLRNSRAPVFLGPYEYILGSTVNMPDGTAIFGCGSKTKIIFTGTSGSAIKMGSECTLRDLQILGSTTELVPGDTYQDRNGIEWSTPENFAGNISNVHVANFEGAAILARNTGTPTNKGLMISDCYLHHNHIGIYIQKNCEFCKISNCIVTNNRYGMISRGGNNNIDTCGFDSNYQGIEIDADEGSNTGHGTICNCSVNHSDSNNGYGLIIKSTGRMLVSNCNFYYSDIRIEGGNGNVISNCGFGNNAEIQIVGGGCSIIDGCMMKDLQENPVKRYSNTTAVIRGCYTRNGAEVGFTDVSEAL